MYAMFLLKVFVVIFKNAVAMDKWHNQTKTNKFFYVSQFYAIYACVLAMMLPPILTTFDDQFYSYYRPKESYRVFNTWMGDPGKVLILDSILKVINRDHLLKNVLKTGEKLKDGLKELECEFPHVLNSTRGRGTFLAINAADSQLRDSILFELKQKGKRKRTTPFFTFLKIFCDLQVYKLEVAELIPFG